MMVWLVISRLGRMAMTFFVILTLVFFATRMTGNPIDFIIGEGVSKADREMLIAYYKLDQSVFHQYLSYLRGILDGDFGLSFRERRPVTEIVTERVWPTVKLLLASLAITLLVAIPFGVIAAVWRNRWPGGLVMLLAFLGYAVPNFVLGMILMLVFSYWLNWLPVVGDATPLHFIMPTIVMSGLMIGSLARFTRNAMLDVLSQDFMRTARAKGLSERVVILRHGLGNASITLLSVIGLQVAATAASGSVVVETIFAWPGIGELLVRAALTRDYPVLQFGVLSVAFAVILINAFVDIAYGWADPRLRSNPLQKA